jgi:hypothetical protein
MSIQNILFDRKLNFKYNQTENIKIDKLFFTDIKYCQKKLPDQFISRNINLYDIKSKKKDVFTDTMNNCVKLQMSDSKELNVKYKKLLLNQNKPGETENETIDTLILNIENEINNLDKNIQSTEKKISFFKMLSQTKINYNTGYNIEYSYRPEAIETVQKVNEILKNISTDKYAQNYL